MLEKFINVKPLMDEADLYNGALKVRENNDTNYLDLFIYGNNERVVVMARLDNLGKGASGAAVQNMNIMLGIDEAIGLE